MSRLLLIDVDPIVHKAAWAAETTTYLTSDPTAIPDHVLEHDSKRALNDYAKTHNWMLLEVEGESELGPPHPIEDGEVEVLPFCRRKNLLDEATARRIARGLYHDIVNEFPGAIPIGFLSYGKTFRHHVAFTSPYKGQRGDKPTHYAAVKDELASIDGVKRVYWIEADDALAIEHAAHPGSVLATIDKDLRQSPGLHYNYDKGLKYKVSPEQGVYQFHLQLLIGDNTDNIKGIKGIGQKKAEAGLSGLPPSSQFKIIKEMYYDAFGGLADARLIENGRLLWMLRSRDDVWHPDTHAELVKGLSDG
jgi:hypothetical protein